MIQTIPQFYIITYITLLEYLDIGTVGRVDKSELRHLEGLSGLVHGLGHDGLRCRFGIESD